MTVAVITSISAVLGAIISGVVSLMVSGRQHDKTIALVEYRISALEKKVEKNNDLQNRVLTLELNDKAQWKRIDELKEDKRNV